MPKFYEQNKKRSDPRYFMDEKLEEAVIDPGLTVAGKWPGEHPLNKARNLAQKGMERAAAGDTTRPPWEAEDATTGSTYPAPSGDSVTDEDVIRSVFNLLKGSSPGHQALAPRFMEMMQERGVVSSESADDISQGYKIRATRLAAAAPEVDADDMEDSLGRFQPSAEQQAWADKHKGPRGV